MLDYAQNVFEQDGRYYAFCAAVRDEDGTYLFDNNAVRQFQYVSKFDDLVYGGSIEYVDSHGRVDAMLRGGRAVCEVDVYEGYSVDEVSEAVQTGKASSAVSFEFIVNSLDVLGRSPEAVRYRLNLVAAHAEKCMANPRYSNFGKDPEPCLDIFKACAANAGFMVDQDRFKLVGSSVEINYATKAGDSLFSVKRYLFDRMYSRREKEYSMKFVYYDFVDKIYRVFDMFKADAVAIGAQTIAVSQQQLGVERMFQGDSIDIGTPAVFTALDQSAAFRKRQTWTYDLVSNSFSAAEFSEAQANQLYNASPDSIDVEVRTFDPVLDKPPAEYNSDWANSANVYEQLRDCAFGCKSIRIEVSGQLACRPGYAVMLAVTNVDDVAFDDPVSKANDEFQRYKGFNGLWYVQGVHGYMDVQKHEFKQVLTLVRSYVAK